MVPLTALAKFAADALLFLSALGDIGKLFNQDHIREEVKINEELRRNAISSYIRKTSRNIVLEDPKQRPTVLPRTRRILLIKNGVDAKSKHTDIGSGVDSSKHVCNEPSTVRPRKRILYIRNGG